MYRKILMLALLVIALSVWLMPDAKCSNCDESVQYCINATHRFWERNICFNNTEYTWNNTENCSYGCLNGVCLPAPTESYDLAIILGLMLSAFFFIYGAFKFDREKHAPLQIFFLFISVYFVLIEMAVLGNIADMSSLTLVDTAVDAGYGLIANAVLPILVFYFVVWFIYELLIRMGKIHPLSFGKDNSED